MARSSLPSADMGNHQRQDIHGSSLLFSSRNGFPFTWSPRGIELKSGLIAISIPFIAADVGSFVGGAAFVGVILVLPLIRNTEATDQGLVRRVGDLRRHRTVGLACSQRVTEQVIAASGGIFLIAGLWTPLAGAVVGITELRIAFSCSDHLRSAALWGALGAGGPCNARTRRLVN